MGPLYRSRIFRRQFFALFSLTLVFFGSMSLAILFRTRQAISARQLVVSSAYRMQVAKHLDDWLSERKSDVVLVARDLETAYARGDFDRAYLAARISSFTEAKPAFIDGIVADRDGFIMASKSAASQRAINIGDRDYVREAFAGSVFVSPYFKGRLTGSASFAVSAPVRSQGRIIAVFAGIITLEALTKIVDEISLSDLGEAYLVDGDRRLVSNPDFAGAFKKSESAVSGFIVDTHAVREIAARREGAALYTDVGGQRVFGSYQWLDSARLGLVVELSALKALLPVTSLLEFSLLLAAAMLSLLVIVAWALSARLIGPIAALVEASQEIMEDRSPRRLDIRTGTELDQLVQAFNSMSARIREREADLRENASRDSLTGLYNHARIEEILDLEFKRKRRSGAELAFVMLDIDRFKRINDEYGHQAGDEALRRLARILEENVREGDIVGRYGGEEFSIILDSAGVDIAALCERIRSRVEAERFASNGVRFPLTVSLGWTAVKADRSDAFDIVRRADRALYEAKSSGRNRVMGSFA